MYIVLKSVGCALCDVTARVYPMFNDGTIDTDEANGTILHECDEEFFEGLEPDDMRIVTFFLWFHFKRGTYFNGFPKDKQPQDPTFIVK
ncbi:MAG: hypothetical protein ACKOXV_08015 [Bacteroidota bacterium]